MLLFPNAFALKYRDIRLPIGVLRKGFPEIGPGCITDHNELLWDLQIGIQKLRMSLEIAQTPLIEDKKVGTGIVAVIRNNKYCLICMNNRIQQAEFHIMKMRTTFPLAEAFIGAVPARTN